MCGGLMGARHVLRFDDELFPQALREIKEPPKQLYLIGDPGVLREGLAVVGARRATPYGISCASHFARLAAERGVVIISGGARGCDSASHRAALKCGRPTVVFLGGGCEKVYPSENWTLFQKVIDGGGAVVSEQDWEFEPMAWTFRRRNRLIAGLARATLIVEAGLPSGTFSTADCALEANREVLVVPGPVTSKHSRGANRLIYQGATPVVDDETFIDQLSSLFGLLEHADCADVDDGATLPDSEKYMLEALQAEPMALDELVAIAKKKLALDDGEALGWLMVWLAHMQAAGLVAKFPNGRYGPILP